MITINSHTNYSKLLVNRLQTTQSHKPAFKGYDGDTFVIENNETKHVTNVTAFMRNFPTLQYTKNYILKNFPNGTNIAEFGCSMGQKPYSLLVMLDGYNDDKKYKITGYDFKEVIDKAQYWVYYINPELTGESILTGNPAEENGISKEVAKKITEKFFKYFTNIDEKQENNSYVRPNKEITGGRIELKEGNILDIDKILKKGESGVVIFQNALYHIHGGYFNSAESNNGNLNKAKDLFKKINNVLPMNGIFVLGNLPADHKYSEVYGSEKKRRFFNGRFISVPSNSKIEAMLMCSGFEPVFYEKARLSASMNDSTEIYLPSVWKKVREY